MTKIAYPKMKKAGYSDASATGIIAAGGTLGILIPPSVVLAIYGFITETDIGELFVSVILSIYFGIVTATEAATVGALMTAVIGFARGRLNVSGLMDSLVEALRTSVAIFTVLIGATLFGYFLAITQVPQDITRFLTELGAGPYGTLFLIMALFLVMGMFLDAMAMIILMVPIVFPVITELGFDPVWFGIIIVMTVELGLITPPVGINVYVINTIADKVSLTTIFRGVLPFVAIDVVRLVLLIAFPALVLFLPETINDAI